MYPIYAVFSCTGRKLLMVNEAFLLIKHVSGYLWQDIAGGSAVVLYICYIADELVKSVRTSCSFYGEDDGKDFSRRKILKMKRRRRRRRKRRRWLNGLATGKSASLTALLGCRG